MEERQIRSMLASLIQRDRRRERGASVETVKKIVAEAVTTPSSGRWEYLASAETLAGTGETVSTEDAWFTVTPEVPTGKQPLLQVFLTGDADTHGGTVMVRKESGAQEITLAQIVFTADSGDVNYTPIVPAPITSTGSCQIRANTTTSAFTWTVKCVGYID
jgi:hypothetical protein